MRMKTASKKWCGIHRLRFVVSLLSLCFGAFWMTSAFTEDLEIRENPPVYVLVNQLNGRATPSRKATVEAIFDQGDKLQPTGQWSKDHCWIEVEGGETGTVWVNIRYVSESLLGYEVTNVSDTKVKVRKHPVNGGVKGYIRKGKTIELTQIVLGWGRYSGGWVDLSYFD